MIRAALKPPWCPMTRRLSIAKLESIAERRKPGYLAAIRALSRPVSATHLEIDNDAFDRIHADFSLTPPRGRAARGPGTILREMLATVGIRSTTTCACNSMARKMDDWGPERSLGHIEEIVDVMARTARERRLPFMRVAGRALVRLACWRSRRAQARRRRAARSPRVRPA